MSFLLRRLGFYLLAFCAALVINFFLPRLAPGDPAKTVFGTTASLLNEGQIRAVREALGLSDAPLIQQFGLYLSHILRGDFGVSYAFFPQPVISIIGIGFGWTLLMGLTTLLFSAILGSLLGVFSAWRRGGALDSFMPPALNFIAAFPPFFLAMTALFYLGYRLHWFPTNHAYDDSLTPGFNLPFLLSVGYHLILPVTINGLVGMSGWMLGMRNSMIGVLAEDYVTMAEAKGLSENRVMLRYGARNAMLPNVTAFGMAFGFVVSGQILVEQVFGYPGLGFLLNRAVNAPDYPLMQGLFMMISTTVLVANFVVDIFYTRLDPRVRA